MKRMRWMSAAFAPALLVMAIGCGGKSSGATTPAGGPNDVAEATAPTDPSGETADEATADLAEHHRHHHHGGFPMFIAMSLSSIGETPEQHAQIEKIRADLFAKLAPAHAAEKNVLDTLADGIAAGNIDQGKIDAAIAQLSTAAAGIHDAVADSLNELHTTLNPQQRTALVGKVEAHLAVWHHTNSVDEPAEKDEHGGHLGTIAKEYGLSHDQVETIRANFHTSIAKAPKYDRAEVEAHMKAFGEAFEGESFDSKTLTTGAAVNGHMATWGVTRMVHFYEAVTPVLTPEQRTKVAGAIRRHANYQRTETGT